MPRSKRPAQQENSGELLQHVYRGRRIEVRTDRDKLRTDRERLRLFIDGQEIEMEQTESGVLSHRFMFKEFGTPFELAEELIKQSGGAEIRPTPEHTDHSHR
jgi:hypothetical protein